MDRGGEEKERGGRIGRRENRKEGGRGGEWAYCLGMPGEARAVRDSGK